MKSGLHLIFDFDGTLADSFKKLMEKFNFFADVFHYRKVSDSELNYLRNLTSQELIQYLGIPHHQLSEVMVQIREHLHNEIQTIAYFPKVPETLSKLRKLNLHLGILTSNSAENVIEWLKYNRLDYLFDFIRIDSSYLDKKIALNKLLDTYKIKKTQAFYIGDETRDIDAAKACGIPAIAVTWGFNSAQILAKQNPNYLINNFEDLLEIFITSTIHS